MMTPCAYRPLLLRSRPQLPRKSAPGRAPSGSSFARAAIACSVARTDAYPSQSFSSAATAASRARRTRGKIEDRQRGDEGGQGGSHAVHMRRAGASELESKEELGARDVDAVDAERTIISSRFKQLKRWWSKAYLMQGEHECRKIKGSRFDGKSDHSLYLTHDSKFRRVSILAIDIETRTGVPEHPQPSAGRETGTSIRELLRKGLEIDPLASALPSTQKDSSDVVQIGWTVMSASDAPQSDIDNMTARQKIYLTFEKQEYRSWHYVVSNHWSFAAGKPPDTGIFAFGHAADTAPDSTLTEEFSQTRASEWHDDAFEGVGRVHRSSRLASEYQVLGALYDIIQYLSIRSNLLIAVHNAKQALPLLRQIGLDVDHWDSPYDEDLLVSSVPLLVDVQGFGLGMLRESCLKQASSKERYNSAVINAQPRELPLEILTSVLRKPRRHAEWHNSGNRARRIADCVVSFLSSHIFPVRAELAAPLWDQATLDFAKAGGDLTLMGLEVDETGVLRAIRSPSGAERDVCEEPNLSSTSDVVRSSQEIVADEIPLVDQLDSLTSQEEHDSGSQSLSVLSPIDYILARPEPASSHTPASHTKDEAEQSLALVRKRHDAHFHLRFVHLQGAIHTWPSVVASFKFKQSIRDEEALIKQTYAKRLSTNTTTVT
ncbi:hypothetical protein IE81DRAFT_327245 [Ceraceosorus guamensis]|uniref:Uncharacterized protein n=1 Tax=Ceraceosorus guamensis TaxID=1522189 RepID=A0A316VM90_9BASI|nr:hypothetical protein IE81DRAFT_327245 [Ceraceosorus guamensis]PWN38686.1 hypothetical protein IE81DRAFT_327245 [Ceraceosorus guamensis]